MTKTETLDLSSISTGIQQQVAAGDTDVEGPLTDVHRDVTRPQVEELHPVGLVDQGEVLTIGTLTVTGLSQQGGRGFRQGTLVRYCYAQQV